MPPEQPVSSPFRILVLHGGGIHGVATAAYLADLESELGCPVRQYFDLIVGTSTGGIIALALSRDVPAADVEALYTNHGSAIFRRQWPLLPKLVTQLLRPLYDNQVLTRHLKKTLGTDTCLGDAKCRLCIPSINITSGRNEVLKTRHHDDFRRDHKLDMWRVGLATSAAPTYFPPAHLPSRGHYVDGGLWANAPIAVGLAEAQYLGIHPSKVQILSIGTGSRVFNKPGVSRPLSTFGHGFIGWGTDLVDLVMRAQTQRGQNLSNYLLPDEHLKHIDFPLPDGVGGLDATEDVQVLSEIARSVAKKTQKDVLKQFFAGRVTPFTPIP